MTNDLRQRILGLNQRRIISEQIQGLDTVHFRSLTELERAQLEARLSDSAAVKRAVIIATVCDADGNLLFRDADFDSLGSVDSAVIDRLSAAALKLNDFTEADVAKMLGEPASC